MSQQTSQATDSSIVAKLNATPGVTVNQPDALTKRLEKVAANTESAAQETSPAVSQTQSGRTGTFRVEVYSDNTRNAKANATARRNAVKSRFPRFNVALVFESPFWRVKVGPYSNRSDAEATLAEIRNTFPAYAPFLRIVRN